MGWLKSAHPKPLSSNQTQPKLRHDIIVLHTMVGYLTSTYNQFRASGFTGTESHVGIGGIWGPDADLGLDGDAWQFQDDTFTADAEYHGSGRCLSIETADNAPNLPEDIKKWTPKQVDKIVEVCTEWCLKYDIPPVLIPDTKPGRRGLAYHYQGVGPNLVQGGELWSKAGHVCPGPVRIKQFKEEVIPRIKQAVDNGGNVALTSADVETILDHEIDLSDSLARAIGGTYKAGQKVSVGFLLAWSPVALKVDRATSSLATSVAVNAQATQATLATILAAVQAVGTGSPESVKAAFDAGIAQLKAELAVIDINITLKEKS